METHGRPPRLKGWDYSRAGGYFVTFVVAGRLELLRTAGGRLSEAGEMVREVWGRLPALFARVELDEVAIMPDHVHAVLRLTYHPTDGAKLGQVVRAWKAASCRRIRMVIPSFQWQSHFYDRVISSHRGLTAVRAYIQENHRSLGPGRDLSRPPEL